MKKIVTIALAATGLGLFGLGIKNYVKNGAPWRFSSKKQEQPAPAAAPAPAPQPENTKPEAPAAQATEKPKEDKQQ